MGQKPGEALERWKNADAAERERLSEIKREKMREAWKMKIFQGRTYKDIAKELDVSYGCAYQYVQDVATEMLELEYGNLPQQRAREVSRIDHIIDGLMPRVNQ